MTHFHSNLSDQSRADGEQVDDAAHREPFRCIACGGAIEKVLADLGSLTCHDHRPPIHR